MGSVYPRYGSEEYSIDIISKTVMSAEIFSHVKNATTAHIVLSRRLQGCGSGLDPVSIGSVDPDPAPGRQK